MKRLLLAVIGVLTLAGCSEMRVDDFAGGTPTFKPEEYFQGRTKAWGFFQDRFGTIKRQFVVEIDGTMDNGTLVMNESFAYADGEKATRVWRIKPLGNGEYEGTAGDVIGTAKGKVAGNAMNFAYEIDLPIQGSTWRVHFDDWMLQQDEEVMLNKSTVTKFGIELGEVFIFFRRLPPG
jgi:hypothetical protein